MQQVLRPDRQVWPRAAWRTENAPWSMSGWQVPASGAINPWPTSGRQVAIRNRSI